MNVVLYLILGTILLGAIVAFAVRVYFREKRAHLQALLEAEDSTIRDDRNELRERKRKVN